MHPNASQAIAIYLDYHVTIPLDPSLSSLDTMITTMESKVLLQRIKEIVYEIEPTAQIFLYGSRARANARPDSDWDILILVDGVVNPSRRDRLRHQIYEIEWETGEVICSIIRSRQEWNTPRFQQTPFSKSIEKEAILL
ncbi:nucleotidyltransferase domain-containing protein [Pseudanabaena cinerea]|nr:nucleotidyltransferase domain-containing protein [Pseudanabaena cinerea]